MIIWPAVIQYDGDDELVYIDSAQTWREEGSSLLYHHGRNDRLIDSRGSIFRLERVDDGAEPEDTTEKISVPSFIKLVRIHASNSHRCCIEKISFRTITEGIALVNSINES